MKNIFSNFSNVLFSPPSIGYCHRILRNSDRRPLVAAETAVEVEAEEVAVTSVAEEEHSPVIPII